MMNSPALKGFVIALLAVIFAFGIYNFFLAKKNYYIADNPSSKIYYFKINGGEEKIISGGQSFPIDLNKGENRISVFDSNKKLLYDSAFNVNKIRGLLNVSHSDYYINTQYYGYNLNRDSLITSLNVTKIDGKDYMGAPKLMNKLYSEDFYYNADEEYDRIIKNVQKVESRTKIFRKQDFINYYNQYYHINK